MRVGSLPLLVLAASSASGAESYLLTGAELAPGSYYAYVGGVLPLGASGSFKQRYWLDRLAYEYEGSPGRVKARASGAEAALGYGSATEKEWWAVYAGFRYRDTTLTPADPTARIRGQQWAFKLQAEGEAEVGGRARLNLIASYATHVDDHWLRARLSLPASNGVRYGAEAVVAGNPDFNARSVGLVVIGPPSPHGSSIAGKIGYRAQSGANGAYGGVEATFVF